VKLAVFMLILHEKIGKMLDREKEKCYKYEKLIDIDQIND